MIPHDNHNEMFGGTDDAVKPPTQEFIQPVFTSNGRKPFLSELDKKFLIKWGIRASPFALGLGLCVGLLIDPNSAWNRTPLPVFEDTNLGNSPPSSLVSPPTQKTPRTLIIIAPPIVKTGKPSVTPSPNSVTTSPPTKESEPLPPLKSTSSQPSVLPSTQVPVSDSPKPSTTASSDSSEKPENSPTTGKKPSEIPTTQP